MMRLSIFIAIASFLCEQNRAMATAQNDAAVAIRQQYTEWLRAYEQKDLAQTMEIFAPDAISTFAGAADNAVS